MLRAAMTAPSPSSSPPPRQNPPRQKWWPQLNLRGLNLQRLARLPLTMMLTSLLAGLGIVQLSFQLGNTVYRTVTGTRQTAEARANIQNLERDVQVLQDAESNANTPGYLRELARCQGFVGTDERIVVSPLAPASPGENCKVLRLP